MTGKQAVVSADFLHAPLEERLLDVSKEDRDWLDDFRILSDLIVAVARARGELTQQNVDCALGLEPPCDEAIATG